MGPDMHTLITALKETLWMARRYANGRQTYAPAIVNRHIAEFERLGFKVEDDPTLVEDGNSNPKTLDTVAEITQCHSSDGTLIIYIDTPAVPENDDGPEMRVYLNDEMVYENPEYVHVD